MQSRKQRSRAHPDPVSCQSCRTKKLRCNRVQPCSNCAARGISCNFLVPPSQRQTDPSSATNSHAELLRRIERLESLVSSKAACGADNNLLTQQFTPTPSSEDAAVPETDQKRDRDLHVLENIGTREDTLLSSLSKDLAVSIRPTRNILENHSLQPTLTSAQKEGGTIVATFPIYSTAVLLFENYQSKVDHVCRILHLPTVRSLMQTVYLRIGQGEPVVPGQAALLFALFALSAFFYQPFPTSEVATTERDAVYLSRFWSRSALDVLDCAHRSTSGTLEDLQACILMSFVTYHLDGNSARRRLLSTTALSIARDLRLHRLDANDKALSPRGTSVRNIIDREVRRRAFWHIAATDWLQSTISGPQEGMYFIHPNHIAVNLPRDCNDDDLALGEENAPIPEYRPTAMSFYLARVRLAHLCREWTDAIPLETSELFKLPYAIIIATDRKLQEFISSLPFFFQLDAESRERSKPLETVYPWIPMMRYCIMTAVHSRRCRLHQKFLLRQSADPQFAYSRQACLESARAVIRLYEDRSGDGDSPAMVTARMGMAVHYTHLAMVVMVMDVCFNGDEADHDERKMEVKMALQMLEPARRVSPLLGRSLDSLCEALGKHNVLLSDAPSPPFQSVAGLVHGAHGAQSDAPLHLEDVQIQPDQIGLDLQDVDFHLDVLDDELWQNAIQSDMGLDSYAWDNFFSALDSRPF